MKRIFTKTRLLILSNYFGNLSATWTAVILISPGLGAVKSVEDGLVLLTKNLPRAIISLVLSIKFAEAAK